ncbi:MAG: hypothetical protein P4M09_27730 [Devosia sp.]|nr:hypothetical protein [Devosia sp.]
MEFQQAKLHGSHSWSPRPEVDIVSFDHLLSMAHNYRDEGNIRQATEIYWSLWDEHSEAVHAQTARAALLELAAEYEFSGARHMARSIYERLL